MTFYIKRIREKRHSNILILKSIDKKQISGTANVPISLHFGETAGISANFNRTEIVLSGREVLRKVLSTI